MKKALLALLLSLLLAAGTSCAKAPEKVSKVGYYFDTVVMLTAYDAEAGVLEGALALCAEYEKLLSKTVPGSDVWNINRAGGARVEVSDATLEILAVAKDVGERSGGAFDITVAPAVALWDFSGNSARLPDAEALEDAAKHIDYRKIAVDGNAVTLSEGMSIDLGGIAKGYIADRLADYLRGRGVARALVNLGGNVATVGSGPNGRWKVGIQDPESPSGEYRIAVGVEGMSVVTSGIYERGFDLDGVRYHHLLDTATGYPHQNGIASATVVTAESVYADALSTAAFSLGVEGGLSLIEGIPGAEVIYILTTGEVIMSSGAGALVMA